MTHLTTILNSALMRDATFNHHQTASKRLRLQLCFISVAGQQMSSFAVRLRLHNRLRLQQKKNVFILQFVGCVLAGKNHISFKSSMFWSILTGLGRNDTEFILYSQRECD